MNAKTVLVVEDDQALMLGLEENLKADGYDVITATDGNEGLRLGMEGNLDCIILDLMLPGMSGYEVCRKLRDSGKDMPIVMLTARQEEFDKLHGFEMGADDYVTKPFSIKELLARIRAVMMRGTRRTAGPKRYDFGECVLDLESRILKRRKEQKGPLRQGSGQAKGTEDSGEEWVEVTLTRTEFDLLTYFCANEGKALSRELVLSEVWGTEYYGTQRSLDSFVASLRSKIEKKAGQPKHILTVHGVGYKFVR